MAGERGQRIEYNKQRVLTRWGESRDRDAALHFSSIHIYAKSPSDERWYTGVIVL